MQPDPWDPRSAAPDLVGRLTALERSQVDRMHRERSAKLVANETLDLGVLEALQFARRSILLGVLSVAIGVYSLGTILVVIAFGTSGRLALGFGAVGAATLVLVLLRWAQIARYFSPRLTLARAGRGEPGTDSSHAEPPQPRLANPSGDPWRVAPEVMVLLWPPERFFATQWFLQQLASDLQRPPSRRGLGEPERIAEQAITRGVIRFGAILAIPPCLVVLYSLGPALAGDRGGIVITTACLETLVAIALVSIIRRQRVQRAFAARRNHFPGSGRHEHQA